MQYHYNEDTFVEKYEDTLQNIEYSIVEVYRSHNDLIDLEVMHVLDALIHEYQSEFEKTASRKYALNDLHKLAYDSAKKVCELRLGRINLAFDNGKDIVETNDPQSFPNFTKTLPEIIACLKKIRSSAKFWNKSSGRQGYLKFIVNFIE